MYNTTTLGSMSCVKCGLLGNGSGTWVSGFGPYCPHCAAELAPSYPPPARFDPNVGWPPVLSAEAAQLKRIADSLEKLVRLMERADA